MCERCVEAVRQCRFITLLSVEYRPLYEGGLVLERPGGFEQFAER